MLRSGRRLVALSIVLACTVAAVLGARWAIGALSAPECVFEVGGQTVTLTPEQAANAATIAAVSVQRGLPPRAATIGLATAMQESKLRNLRYGHADSQGLFQQRPSQGWGSVEQVTDPVYASNAFYAALERVPGWEEGVVTEVAQEVQRSAFPEAYAAHEGDARVLASILTGQEGASTQLGCDLDRATPGGSVSELATKLDQQLGVDGQVDPGAATLTVVANDEQLAWATATWAITHADAEEVTRVQLGGQRWDRSTSRWRAVAGSSASSTTVVVTVG